MVRVQERLQELQRSKIKMNNRRSQWNEVNRAEFNSAASVVLAGRNAAGHQGEEPPWTEGDMMPNKQRLLLKKHLGKEGSDKKTEAWPRP